MGCSSSRLDDLPAVALCRRRRKSMDAANKHFTSFAESHSAYMQSMNSIGQALVNTLAQFPPHPPSDPKTKLDVVAKVDDNRNKSDSGHIQFTPSSDDDEEKADQMRAENTGSSYGYLMNGVEDRFGGLAVAVHGSRSDMPPPPPPPPPPKSSLTWDLMNFFTPCDMSLHYPESYNLLCERVGMDAEERKIEVQEVVQVNKTGKSEVKVTKEKPKAKGGKEENKEVSSSSEAEHQKKMNFAVDVLEEVKVLFEKASESGIGVSKLLKAESDHNHVFQLDSSEKANLPSILRKLSIWEHKLHTEVKAEEEMRLRHEDLQKRLKKQDDKGSEAQKVDATQKAMMSLMPKMKIAFDMVNRISIVISKLRDEELWPCIKEFIHELQGMWVALVDCHTQQAKAIKEVADLHSFPSDGELTNAQLEAAMELKQEFQNWIISFCNWICAQKGYVKSLNKWLQRCYLPELKQQSDSDKAKLPLPSSSAPLISVIFHNWLESMNNIEDAKVVEAMEACVASVNQLLRRLSANIQQRVIIDGDLEKRVKKMEAKDKEMLKALEVWKKNVKKDMPTAASGIISTTDASVNDPKNLQPELKRTLESLEALATSFVHIYQDLSANAEDQVNGRQCEKR